MKTINKLWLEVPAKLRAQAARFIRLFSATFIVQFLAAGEPVHWKLICAVIISAAETVFRQVFPTKPTEQSPVAPQVEPAIPSGARVGTESPQ